MLLPEHGNTTEGLQRYADALADYLLKEKCDLFVPVAHTMDLEGDSLVCAYCAPTISLRACFLMTSGCIVLLQYLKHNKTSAWLAEASYVVNATSLEFVGCCATSDV